MPFVSGQEILRSALGHTTGKTCSKGALPRQMEEVLQHRGERGSTPLSIEDRTGGVDADFPITLRAFGSHAEGAPREAILAAGRSEGIRHDIHIFNIPVPKTHKVVSKLAARFLRQSSRVRHTRCGELGARVPKNS